MIWQNPWAWAGLAALALPIVIHLLGRGKAPLHRFPTLRFIDPSRLLPTRRTRIQDPWLLLLRLLILAVAVAALARPLFSTAARQRGLDAALARAIVVDTGTSMQRITTGGGTARAAAQQTADRLATEAATAVILPASTPGDAIPGALAWLARQTGRAELVIISDFQTGTLDSLMLATVPIDVGIALERIPVDSTPLLRTVRLGEAVVAAEMTADGDRIDVTWSRRGAAPAASLRLLAGPAELSGAQAALAAAASIATPLPADSARPVALVFPQYAERAQLLAQGVLPTTPWMTDLLRRIATDPLLNGMGKATSRDSLPDSAVVVLRRDETGAPLVTAAVASLDGTPHLLFFLDVDAGSLGGAAVIAAVQRGLTLAPSNGELESGIIPEAWLTAARRPSAADGVLRPAAAESGLSDGRWFWVVVLLLLGLETLARRTPRTPDALADTHV